MKKQFLVALAVLLVCVPVTNVAQAQDIAGTIERIRGDASRQQDGLNAPLSVGAEILVGDVITTGDDARLRILFADQSTLSLGEFAEMKIDDLVYTPAGRNPESGGQSLKYVKGVFEYVSGRIGKNLSDQVVLNTPVATIGIRGTRVLAGELTVGMPPGEPHYGFQILEGAVVIAAPLGSVILDEPGEGTFLPLTRQAAPTPVRQWTAEEAAEARNAVAF